MKGEFRNTEDIGELTLSGDMTVGCMPELRFVLAQSLATVTRLDVRILGDALVDLPFSQILCSAYKTAATLSKKMYLAAPAPSEARMAEESGYLGHSRCSLENAGDCFWVNHD